MQLSKLSNKQGQPTIIKWLITLMLTLPFLLPWYYPPYVDFYMDITVIMLGTLLLTYLLFNIEKIKVSILAMCLVSFAVYLPIQAVLLDFPYIFSSVYSAGFFVLLALLLTAFLSISKDHAALITYGVLWGVVILTVVQLVLYTTQLAIIDPETRDRVGWMLFAGEGGQVGQRNNFSHIIMWGFIASIILQSIGKLSSSKMWLLILCCSIAMAHAGSRTVILYIIGLSIMVGYQWMVTKNISTKPFSRNIVIALAIALCAQFIVPFITNIFLSSNVSSGTDRLLVNSAYAYIPRWLEWQKAWLMFLDAPMIGQGWGTYGFQSFWYHDQVATIGDPRENNFFSHCHNLLLQLLAEVGLLGTLLLILPTSYIFIRAFFKYAADVTTFGLLMMCVISLIHSMVEFPLWHSNFLIVFSIMLFLIVRRITVDEEDVTSAAKVLDSTNYNKYGLKTACIAYSVLTMLFVVIILLDHERQVNKAFAMGGGIYNAQSLAIGEQGKYIPFYNKYADKISALQVNPDIGTTDQLQQSDKLLVDNMLVFPYYTHTAAHIIYLQKMGRTEEAKLWLDKTALYYPRVLPGLIRLTQKYPAELGYLQQYTVQLCEKAVISQMYALQKNHCEIPIIN